MSEKDHLLIEIGCEELPARLLGQQVELLAQGLAKGLADAGLIESDTGIETFATPRRLAVRIGEVAGGQPDQVLEKKGPSVDVAFDDHGKPTKAAEGFARSVGKSVEELDRMETDQGAWLFTRVEQPGRSLVEIVPEVFDVTVRSMAGARSMRWSDRDERFLRPVRWLAALHGERVIEFDYFGLSAGRVTRGHRIHAPGEHEIEHPRDYEQVLERAFVLADSQARAARIRAQVGELSKGAGLEAIMHEDLLEEVAGLTEWPAAVMGSFDPAFLEVPEEALVSSMEQHQKCFALRSGDGSLAPKFIAIANIESVDAEAMTAGFERVIRPRLADARFFWDQDRKTSLEQRRERLDEVLFQKDLGSIGDKVRRLEKLAPQLAEALGTDGEATARAAGLCKCDLLTEMVGEFPELQGIMGRYYALADGEPKAVAQAIESHYRPRHAGDALPADGPGRALALADRLDTLTGVFAAGQKPKGGKDPFALRRAALGVIRLLDETDCDLSLRELLDRAAAGLNDQLRVNGEALEAAEQFIMERLRPWAAEHGIEANTIHAVAAGQTTSIADFMARVRAVQAFADNPEVASLIAANKRASNLLKQAEGEDFGDVDRSSLQIEEERALFEAVIESENHLDQRLEHADYPAALEQLAGLRTPVDRFFDEVMVMADDETLRRNRLALLSRLRSLFLRIADVARLGR